MIHKGGKMTTKEVKPPEGNISDFQQSYKYLGVPQANGNIKKAPRKSATTKGQQR